MNNYEHLIQGGIDSLMDWYEETRKPCGNCARAKKKVNGSCGHADCIDQRRLWLEAEYEDTIELLKSDICAHYDIGCMPSDWSCEGCEVQGWLDRAEKIFGMPEERKEQARKLAEVVENFASPCKYYGIVGAGPNACEGCPANGVKGDCHDLALEDIARRIREIAGI